MDEKAEILYLENQLCFPLYAASRLITQIYTPLLNELGVTYPQYLVLMVLWRDKEQTVNEICTKLLLESNTITPLLKRMEQKRIISRRRSDADERIVIISLTSEGEALKQKALTIPEKIIASVNDDSISHEEILHFKDTLNKLITALSK